MNELEMLEKIASNVSENLKVFRLCTAIQLAGSDSEVAITQEECMEIIERGIKYLKSKSYNTSELDSQYQKTLRLVSKN